MAQRPAVRVPMTRERRGTPCQLIGTDGVRAHSTIAAMGKQRVGAGGVASLGAGASNAFDESEDEEGEQLRSAMTASCLSYEREQILRAQVA